jgi:hypothetical protein
MCNGVLCPACASCEERSEDLKENDLPYGWGKVQGVLLLISGFGLLPTTGEDGFGFVQFDAALNMFLGVCILRRNRLVLPLFVIVIGLMFLNLIVGGLAHNRDTASLSFTFPIWLLFASYYYVRRREFKRWL